MPVRIGIVLLLLSLPVVGYAQWPLRGPSTSIAPDDAQAVGSDTPRGNGTALLKAEIAQLKAQVQQLKGEAAVCEARVAIASQPSVQQQQAKDRAAIEKDAGCAIDWAVSPPVCKPSPTR